MVSKRSLEINFDGISLDGKKFKDWDSKTQEAFFEGFKSNTLSSNNNKAVYGTGKNSSKSSSGHWTDKFNIGNPDTDNGHWVTLDNGKHIFIKDEKGSKKSLSSSSTSKTSLSKNNGSSNNSNNSKSSKSKDNKSDKPSKKMKGNMTGDAANMSNANHISKNNIEKSIENVLNMYNRNSKLQEQDVKKIIGEIEKLGNIASNLQKKSPKEKFIIIFQGANNEQKQQILNFSIGKLYNYKQLGIYKNVKDFSGPDTAGMLDLAHGEENMNDKNYIKDTIKIKNWNDALISSDKYYWKNKVEGQFGKDGYNTDKISGYFFKNNSESSKRLSESEDLKNMLKKHKKEILNGENFSDEFPQYGNDLISKMGKENNFKNAFGKVDFRHPLIDYKGNLHVIMCDTYDFNNEDNILIQAGRNQMKKGNLKPFFTIHEIIIPKNKADKILK